MQSAGDAVQIARTQNISNMEHLMSLGRGYELGKGHSQQCKQAAHISLCWELVSDSGFKQSGDSGERDWVCTEKGRLLVRPEGLLVNSNPLRPMGWNLDVIGRKLKHQT